MADHLTEEEQLEALKRRWRENGKSTLLGVCVALAAYFAWGLWKDHQRQQTEAASALFQGLLEAVAVEPGKTLTEEKRSTAMHLAGQLKDAHSSSLYAYQAALFMAKLAVEKNELDKAAEQLRWILSQGPTTAIERVVRLRLSRVLLAQQNYKEALSALSGEVDAGFESVYAEVRGDIYVAQGEDIQARAAYQAALDKLSAEQNSRRAMLQMKLDNLKTATDDVASLNTPRSAPEKQQ